jgi:hypothetical protein
MAFNFAHRIRPSCLRQSQAWRRQDTCAVEFRDCPGRLALVDATGEVERGAVTGTEEAARPVGVDAGLRTGLELLGRRAAQVGTDADSDENFRLDRARLVLAYSGCMFLSDLGSASLSATLARVSSCSLVRLMIQTGLPRHSTVII